MKSLNNILVAGVSAIALLAAAPLSADDKTPVTGKRMLPHNNMNTEPLNPPGPAGHRNSPAAGTGPNAEAPTSGPASKVAVGAIGADWLPTDDIPDSDLVGADVVTAQNKVIGQIARTSVVDGKTSYIVVVDEHMGMGSRSIEIAEKNASVFRNRADLHEYRIAVDMDEDQVRNLPEYKHGAVNTMDRKDMKHAK